jgi:hypothetical protein
MSLTRTPPIGDWIRAQQAAHQHSLASAQIIQISNAVGLLVAGSMGQALGVSDATTRAIAGVATGATYAESLASLGALAGPYGAAIGAVVGFGAGLVQGSWPVTEDAVSSHFASMLANLTPGIRMRLWTWGHTWGAVCRAQFHEPPLPVWQFVGQDNVNEFGSAEIMATRCLQSLWNSDCWPDTNPAPGALPAMALAQLPPWAVYALACYGYNLTDAQTILPGDPSATTGQQENTAEEVILGILSAGYTLTNLIQQTGPATITSLRNRGVLHPEMTLWIYTHWSTPMSVIRARAAGLGMTDSTILPVDAPTTAIMTDVSALALGASH